MKRNAGQPAPQDDKFVWRLKAQMEGESGIKPSSLSSLSEPSTSSEPAPKKMRGDAADTRDHLERERAHLASQASLQGNAEYKDWDNEEVTFRARQAKLRAVVRIRGGRAKPVDILFLMLNREKHAQLAEEKRRRDNDETVVNGQSTPSSAMMRMSRSSAAAATTVADLFEEDDVAMLGDIVVAPQDPLAVVESVSSDELREVLEDVEMYAQFDDHIEFWSALRRLCLHALRERDPGASTSGAAARVPQLPASVRPSVIAMLSSKNVTELNELKDQINAKLSAAARGTGVAVDVDYWEGLLLELEIFQARALLRESFESLCSPISPHGDGEAPAEGDVDDGGSDAGEAAKVRPTHLRSRHSARSGPVARNADGSVKVGFGGRVQRPQIHASGPSREEPVSESRRRLEQEAAAMRERVRAASEAKAANEFSADDLLAQERSLGMQNDQEEFDMEFPLPVDQKPKWLRDAEDGLAPQRLLQIQPVKPKFFNRVQTGYVWHKYNSAHYDKDNPPPKQIFSYKFNIFYPELLDRNVAPTFVKKPAPLPGGAGFDPDNELLVFSAGAPYDDLAFKIQKKEWEHSSKFGFKCKFERGVLHLWFHFKRTFYRR